MNDFFLAVPLLPAFLLASFVLAATPGPAVVYIVARTLAQGRAAGFASVAGVALGNFGNAAGASIGLAALFAISATAFSIVKFAGAAYLVYLGIKALRPRATDLRIEQFEAPRLLRIFRDGFLVALLNPKTAIFFAAFLPQFIETSASKALHSMALGGVFVLISVGTDTAYVFAAGAMARRVGGRGPGGPAAARYATAATFIGLGIFTAVAGSRAAR
ncbi:MAG TPA: LysE family translocator [Rhizobacter sp.]|nr:LysE family translocator [Rhizobacter sp.]